MSIKNNLKRLCPELYYPLNSLIMWIPITCPKGGRMRINGLHMGKKAYLARNVKIYKPRNVSIGDCSVINSKALWNGGEKLQIGSDVDVTQESIIWTIATGCIVTKYVLSKTIVAAITFKVISSRDISLEYKSKHDFYLK